MPEPLLELKGVKTHFALERGMLFGRAAATVKAVDGVSLSIARGEVLGLVGESGCGKSTLARTILQLLPPTEGAVILAGRNLAELAPEELRAARAGFQMVFQDPYASLNPRMTVYDTIAEAIQAHRAVSREELAAEVSALLNRVGLAARFSRKYPHEFSGGQRQRIAVARALAVQPQLIVADEPVSALDVSIQAQIINLLARLTREMGLTMIFISHDLAVVKHISDRIAVMYLGKIVELGPAAEVLEHPLHPYTKALSSAMHLPDPERERTRRRIILEGDPPSPVNPPAGCSFHPRCAYAIPECNRIAVMYLGKIVELGPAAEVLEHPLHPYTKALSSAMHLPDPERERARRRIILEGDPPSPVNPPAGCSFHPRCAYAIPECSRNQPHLEAFRAGHEAACLRLEQVNAD